MRSDAPEDCFTGSATTSDNAWHTPLPYVDMLKRCRRWMLWVSNDGPAALEVQFTASPDGSNPDAASTVAQSCPSMQAVCAFGDELHRYWAISVQSPTGTPCTYRWGVTMEIKGLP